MIDFFDLAKTRRSIRKYQEKDIDWGAVEDLIRIAVTAPSGCNSQCWKFVAIKDKEILKAIEDAAMRKINELTHRLCPAPPDGYLDSKRKSVGFFTKAPVTVAVFMTGYHFYDPLLESAVKANGLNDDEMMELLARPDILSIGAAVQNLLLAAHEKGYGACWMNEPAIAGKEINKILNVPPEFRFMSLIPIGYPAYTPREKRTKEFQEIFSVSAK